MVSLKKILCLSAVAVLCTQGKALSGIDQKVGLTDGAYTPTSQDLEEVHRKFLLYQNRVVPESTPLPVPAKNVILTNASASDRNRARTLVDQAIDRQGEYNLWRIAHPQRGNENRPNTGQTRRDASAPSPPKLTPELLRAIKLINDVDTQELHNNGTLQWYREDAQHRAGDLLHTGSTAGGSNSKSSSGWDGSDWMEKQDHSLSQQPFNSQSDYKASLVRAD